MRRRRRPETPARVTVLPDPEAGPATTSGPLRSIQEAEVELAAETLAGLWRPEYLERLAAAYWRYLSRVSRGAIRVVYAPDARTIVLFGPRLPLLRFRAPRYETSGAGGSVTWPIDRGLLVARAGRGQGYLRITVSRSEREAPPGQARVLVRSEVANFYPLLRGEGRFARLGARLYNATQLRAHVLITHGFLRSLARLDLPPSAVGALRDDPGDTGDGADQA